MAFEPVTAAQRLSYNDAIELALQQKRSYLEMCATYQPNLKGKQSRIIELFGPDEGEFDKPRASIVQVSDSETEQVWCRPRRLNTKPKLLETEDEIKNGTNYSSPIVQSNAATLNKMKDRILADALTGPRITGEDGLTITPYSNTNGAVAQNYVPSGVATDSGLTVPKIVKGLELLERAEVDVENEEVFLQATSTQITDLYNQLTYTSKDYRDRAVLDEARKLVREILGVKIIRMPDTYVPKAASTRSCMLFAKSGLHYGEFSPVETTMDRSPAHYNRVLMFAEMWCGATRSEDNKFVKINCVEA